MKNKIVVVYYINVLGKSNERALQVIDNIKEESTGKINGAIEYYIATDKSSRVEFYTIDDQNNMSSLNSEL